MKKDGGGRAAPAGGRRRSQAGVALILTVWVLAMLTAIVAEFVFSGRLKVRADRNLSEGLRAYALAVGGYQAALAAIGPELTGLSLGGDGGMLLHYRQADEGAPSSVKDIPLGEGAYSYAIVDEDSRLNINRQTRKALTRLLQNAGVELGAERDTIIDSALDWVDPNREHRLNGAEEDYYRSLDPPYSCKDGPFDVAEELLLLRGMKKEYFYGGEVEGRKIRGLRDLITVYPVILNLSTASDEVLKVTGQNRAVGKKAISRYFSITAKGKISSDGPERTIRATVLRQGRGRKITFRLLYWNDDYVSKEQAANGEENI